MANKKISELNSATTPLAGTEEIPIVQGGETKKVAISEFGGSTPNLQAVTNVGNTTTNSMLLTDGLGNELNLANNVLSFNTSEEFLEISSSGIGIGNNTDFKAINLNLIDGVVVETNGLNNRLFIKSDNLTIQTTLQATDGDGTIATQEWVTANVGSNVITEINTTGTASSGTAETITYSILIPANTMSVGIYDAITRVNKTGTAGTVTVKMYANDTNNLTTPILIGSTVSTATGRYLPLQKFIDIKVLDGTGLGTEVANNVNSASFQNDLSQHGNTAGMSNVAIDWTIDQYLIVTVTNANAGDSSTGTFLILKK